MSKDNCYELAEYPDLAKFLHDSHDGLVDWSFTARLHRENPGLLSSIWKAVATLNKLLPDLPAEITGGRQGGVLFIGRRGRDHDDPLPPAAVRLGEDLGEDEQFGFKHTKHVIYGLAKYEAIAQDPTLTSSDQDTQLYIGDPENRVPAGGIALPDEWIVSFSGFPDGQGDEYFVMLFAFAAGLITRDQLEAMPHFSSGVFTQELLDRLAPQLSGE